MALNHTRRRSAARCTQRLTLAVSCLSYRSWYDPLKKETNLNAPALKKWLANGAVPSETVESLLKRAYIMEPDAVKVVVPKEAVQA